ncbi:class A beta-lactamase [Sabulicella rubraurantiaca]|uniref:class A beta-lactamase n=1 Tax=Sabulicella rubraurantiaca TaxID=2811429 RepID=UPI001A96D613|nr:class A beta-lactamase [Sabulicella rubraurantiaca]
MTTGRRALLLATGLASPALAASPLPGAFREAEALGGGRLGVAALDTGSRRRAVHRAEERFPFASTFKMVLASAVLAAVAQGRASLDRAIPVSAADMVPHAPVTERAVGGTMTVEALCEATMVWSDNPAANLLLPMAGGPAGLTAFARNLGDPAFRLDRIETALNQATPGDPRDTTTPAAMLGTMQRLLLDDALPPEGRDRLTGWMVACRTGDAKIRAGLPTGWRCGDRTGGGGHGTNNCVAILWPPGRAPVLVAAYLTETALPLAQRDAALASVGRAVAEAWV